MKKVKVMRRKKGFTLIELMLVVTIIVVLLGFMVPKFSSYQERAKKTKALNTAKQMQTAAMASYGDKDGKFDGVDVKAALNELTTADIDNVEVSGDSSQTLTINYKSDNKACVLNVNASDNSYTLNYDGIKIFPK